MDDHESMNEEYDAPEHGMSIRRSETETKEQGKNQTTPWLIHMPMSSSRRIAQRLSLNPLRRIEAWMAMMSGYWTAQNG